MIQLVYAKNINKEMEQMKKDGVLGFMESIMIKVSAVHGTTIKEKIFLVTGKQIAL